MSQKACIYYDYNKCQRNKSFKIRSSKFKISPGGL